MKEIAFRHMPELSYAGNEAINTLCTNLTFSGENVKKILVTSCHASEGKSFLSLNIVRTLAKLGDRVALVDCDLRKSVIARKHLVTKERKLIGLTHYLAGMEPAEEAIYSVLDVPNLFIVPSGHNVSNSLPLVSSPKLGQLLDSLAEEMDYVIVDAPPVGLLIDAAKIATFCDGTLLVVNYNTVRKQELIDAQAQLSQTGCPILGTVINQANFRDYMSRKYYYSKYYYSHYKNYYYYGEGSSEKRPAARGAKQAGKE